MSGGKDEERGDAGVEASVADAGPGPVHVHTHPPPPPHTGTRGAVGRHSRVFIAVGRAGAQGASSTSSLCMYEFSQWRRSRAASSRARSRKAASSASARLLRDWGVAGPARAPPEVRSLPGDGMRRLPWVPARRPPPVLPAV